MRNKKLTPARIMMYAVLVIVLIFMLVPFIWLVISSFRPNTDLFNEPFSVPEHLSFDNYRAVMASHPMLLYFANSVAVAAAATVDPGGLCHDAPLYDKKTADGSIFHVSVYTYKCIYGAILCYDK